MYSFHESNPLYRVMRLFAALKPVSWVFARTLPSVDATVFRLPKGRMTFVSLVAGLPVAMCTTTGAKSGLPRTFPVVLVPAGGEWFVFGSNFGDTRDPAWCYNLRANPKATLEFEGKRQEVVAREVDAAERDKQFARGAEIYPGYLQYRKRAGRVIPAFRLTPTGPAQN